MVKDLEFLKPCKLNAHTAGCYCIAMDPLDRYFLSMGFHLFLTIHTMWLLSASGPPLCYVPGLTAGNDDRGRGSSPLCSALGRIRRKKIHLLLECFLKNALWVYIPTPNPSTNRTC